MEDYGNRVVEFLHEEGNKAALVLSRDFTNKMLHGYSDYFEEKQTEQGLAIVLRSEKGIDDLIQRFRTYIDVDVLLAFTKTGFR